VELQSVYMRLRLSKSFIPTSQKPLKVSLGDITPAA
tara:strand:+ start:55064 stop:55171 length:108 start_codon:yes stop_codon:yes gene_type:complete